MSSINLGIITILMLVTAIEIVVEVRGQEGQETLCQTVDENNSTVPGYCINIKSQLKLCPSHYNLLKNRDWVQLRRHICSADNKRVCCPIKDFDEVQRTEEDRLNQVNYRDHPNFQHFPALRSCGLSFHSSGDRIINGNTSLPGEFPWVARIGMRNDGDPTVIYPCGGSIISKRYVLTAAHCFKWPDRKLVHVRVGQSDEDKEEECVEFTANRRIVVEEENSSPIACAAPIDMDFEEIILHPDYTRQLGSSGDIALIRLAADIDIKSYFTKPICLPFLNEYQVSNQLQEIKTLRDEKTLVAGFGKVNNDEQVGSSTLQFVRSPIQANIMCRISYPSFNVTPQQICAGGVSGSGSCLGDSGGPLFVPATPERGPSRSLRSFQVGIVSYGKTKCGQGNEPVVYTKVRSYLTWILDNIRP